MAVMACIGTGLVGRAWAVVFARAGHEVRLWDQQSGVVEDEALPAACQTLELLAEHGALDEEMDQILARLKPAPSLAAAVRDASWVQESVAEDPGIKQGLYFELCNLTRPDCILASSTSAIKGSDFMGDTPARTRALVAHPVNPPSLIPLVELCATSWTAPDVVDRARSFLEAAGLSLVTLSREIDGFILNRLQYTLVAEAMHLIGEGYCTASDIDRVITDGLALRWATIGPFMVSNLNAENGFKGFVDRLGPMMKAMGASAQTDYDWGPDEVAAIHAELTARVPVEEIPARQLTRDRGILGVRALQDTLSEKPAAAD